MKLVLGTANFGSIYSFAQKKRLPKKEIIKNIKFSLKLGINHFDTANKYSLSENYLGLIKKNIKIISKISGLNPNKVSQSLNQNLKKTLKKIKKNYVDYLLIHDFEFFKTHNPKSIVESLKKIKSGNKCKKFGFSVYEVKDIKLILRLCRPDAIQLPVSLFDRRIITSNLIKILKRKKIEIHARSIFMKGALILNNNQLPKNLKKIDFLHKNFENWCTKNKISKIQACVNYIKSLKCIDKVVFGVDNKEQLEEVVGCFKNKSKIFPKKIFTKQKKLLDIRKW